MAGPGHGEKLTRNQEAAIAALLDQPTQEAAAGAVGVTPKTLREWLKQPAFQRAYREARREIVEGAVVRLQQLCLSAVLALHRNLTCGNAAVETRAADIVLGRALEAVELGDLAQRLDDLERRLQEHQQQQQRQVGANRNGFSQRPAGASGAGGEPPPNGRGEHPDPGV